MIYTFYPCKPEGHSDTFAAIDLPDDAEAAAQAARVLADHDSCAYVVVWQEARRVVTKRRESAEA